MGVSDVRPQGTAGQINAATQRKNVIVILKAISNMSEFLFYKNITKIDRLRKVSGHIIYSARYASHSLMASSITFEPGAPLVSLFSTQVLRLIA